MILPKLSGLDVLRLLKANPHTQDIPVIVVSALSKANRGKLVKEGAAAFLEKFQNILGKDSRELIETAKGVFDNMRK